jgi:hypothetical protein
MFKILHLLELVKLWNKSAKPRNRQNVLSTICDSLLRPTQFDFKFDNSVWHHLASQFVQDLFPVKYLLTWTVLETT